MKWLRCWEGACFGYRDGDALWTYGGKHVGKFYGDEIYGADGRYLGECKSGNRLITNTAKSNRRKARFTPRGHRGGYARYVGYVGYVMYAGYTDFPAPESF